MNSRVDAMRPAEAESRLRRQRDHVVHGLIRDDNDGGELIGEALEGGSEGEEEVGAVGEFVRVEFAAEGGCNGVDDNEGWVDSAGEDGEAIDDGCDEVLRRLDFFNVDAVHNGRDAAATIAHRMLADFAEASDGECAFGVDADGRRLEAT